MNVSLVHGIEEEESSTRKSLLERGSVYLGVGQSKPAGDSKGTGVQQPPSPGGTVDQRPRPSLLARGIALLGVGQSQQPNGTADPGDHHVGQTLLAGGGAVLGMGQSLLSSGAGVLGGGQTQSAGGTVNLGAGQVLRLYKSPNSALLERQDPNTKRLYVTVSSACTSTSFNAHFRIYLW